MKGSAVGTSIQKSPLPPPWTVEKWRMAHRRILILASAGALALALLPLQAEPSDDEKKALHTAEESFNEGAFDLCNNQIAYFLKKYPKSELAVDAELLQARALYQMGHSEAVLAALN